MKKLDEILSKGCKDALTDFFGGEFGEGTGITTLYDSQGHTGSILVRGYKNFKSQQFKKVEAEYYALANGPCGIFAGTQEQKLRYKKDLEKIMEKV